jgi:hypothetical protein
MVSTAVILPSPQAIPAPGAAPWLFLTDSRKVGKLDQVPTDLIRQGEQRGK